ncbi:hypothetical protein DI005_00205 [Prauserella sp. PE36]|uniref:Uncharacterized protein n=1 Tax=Prauserella endophytica TaxID=1592324 RepID=A0ABY2S122_9PSEU|nr:MULTISPECIES: hypothetical protein [Prauserella]PXY17220.1 hypothetical protein BAY59_37320 [Prauserella coralliicola]RBM24452.1 hypothetical protein DI005_00205 [Prauserella sp. PE36]TKG67665.1 hypothetical protein FCN18_23230 [Prauserella endophytica]
MLTRESVLRRAAFGDAPDIHDGEPAAAASPRERWLAAVVLGARGGYAAAMTLLDPLRRGRDPLLAALAGATLASHRRQLGGHAAAVPLDGAALRHAALAAGPADEDGLDPAGALADALLGLAADNLGRGRLTAARRLIATATAHSGSWRTRVRLGWVSAEVALAAGDAAEAVPHAERAEALARERGAVRHEIKSALVLGAALAATGEPAARRRATELVGGALEATGKYRLGSLAWPAGLLAAELDPERADWNRSRVTRELYALLPASDPEGRRLALSSPWVPI